MEFFIRDEKGNKIATFIYFTATDDCLDCKAIIVKKGSLMSKSAYCMEKWNDCKWIEDDRQEAIKNAKVEISDGTKSTMFLLYEDNLKSFYYVDSISFKFQEGKKYDLNILSDGKEINSSMTIPNGAEILKIAYDTSAMSKLELKNGLSTVNRDVNLSIEINGKDYYCFVSAVVFGSCFIQTASGSINKKIEKHIYFNTDPTLPMKLDGKNNFNVTDKLSLSTNHSIVSYTLEFDSIQYYTVTIEENYYEYLKSKKLQSSSQNDPFAEPSLLYSNVYNGLGIFTGIASRKSIATFK